MAVIVVDTNVLVASPFLESRDWSSLIEHAADWGVEIVVPDVVLMETVSVVKRTWATKRQKLDDLDLGVFELDEAKSAMMAEIDKRTADYEEWLRTRLDEIGVKIAPTPPIDHMDIARRASEGRAPYCSKDKDGYRDTLVWCSVVAIAQESPGAEVWFVSDNHTDFGPKPPDWTGTGTGKRDDCPILFHTHLIAELADQGLDGRVFYVVSLARIEQHLASQFAPIDETELGALVRNIDFDVLAERLVQALVDLSLDPEECALPVGVLAANIVGSREARDGWIFSEAARRGDSGWTARFSVDTEVDIAMAGGPSVESEHTKVLRLVGQARVSSVDSALVDIEVDSAKALPEDPMRDRWSRRASRDPESLAETLARLQVARARIVGRDANFGNLAGFAGINEQINKDIVGLAGVSEQMKKSFAGLAGFAGISEQLAKNYVGIAGVAGISEQLTKNIAGLAGISEQLTKNFSGIAGLSEQVTKSFADVAGVTAISDQIRKAMENTGGPSSELDDVQLQPESGVSKPTDDATDKLSTRDPTASSVTDADDAESSAAD